MGIALTGFVDFWTPLQSLAHRLLSGRPPRRSGSGLHYVAVRPACSTRTGHTVSASPAPRATKPLRVVRVTDRQDPGACSQRVVISGRMADVCAELDRLAALEATERPAMPSTARLH